jgi:hypothetical protein
MGTQWNDRVDDQRMSAHQFNETGRVGSSAGVTLPAACRLRSSCFLILP